MKNFIFDIDRTLFDSYSIERETLKKALLVVTNKTYDDQTMDKLSVLTTKEFFSLINIDTSSKIMKEINFYWDKFLKDTKIKLFPGMEKQLLFLKENKCFLAIATSRTKEEFKELSEFSKIEKLFTCIITSDMVKNPKPDPESILKIITDFSLDKRDTIYVGDSFSDYLASKKASVKFAYASYDNKNSTNEYDYLLKNVNDISKLIYKK